MHQCHWLDFNTMFLKRPALPGSKFCDLVATSTRFEPISSNHRAFPSLSTKRPCALKKPLTGLVDTHKFLRATLYAEALPTGHLSKVVSILVIVKVSEKKTKLTGRNWKATTTFTTTFREDPSIEFTSCARNSQNTLDTLRNNEIENDSRT